MPVGCSFRSQDVFDNRHACDAGDIGLGIAPKLAARLRDADLVLALGDRLGELVTADYTLLRAPKPVQRPYPPVWIGGGGEQKTLRVVAEHADG